MEVIQNREGLVATLTVKVSQEDYATQVEKGLRKARQTAQIKGFRPGNAPMSLIRKMYIQSLVVEEINKIVPEFIANYEKENGDDLIGHVIPSDSKQWQNLSEFEDFEFEYKACFYPEFTYKIDSNTELPYYNILIEDKDIDEEINYYRNAYQPFDKADEVCEDCLITVSINLQNEGEEKVRTARILLTAILDEYKPLFLGAKVNDVINVEIRKVFTSEVDLMEMLAVGREEFELLPESLPFTINKILKKEPYKTEQDFYNMVTNNNHDINSEENLRDYIREHIVADYETMSLNKLYLDSVKVLIEKVNIDLPKDFARKYIRFLQKENDEIPEEQMESYVQYFIDETVWNYTVKSLFKQNNITITYEMIEDEAKAVIKETYGDYTYYNMTDLVHQYLSSEEHLHNAVSRAQRKQLACLLKENAKLNVIDVTKDEFREICNKKKDNKEE
ncbi:MAG: trigger factor family protein [Prevotellaceae bacterium]|jgi:trigger factor|nr:trigger factor family protein [Prevotellaceae bacterium]